MTFANGESGASIRAKLNINLIKSRAWADVVADFGATGDGTTDDTAAIQAALDAEPVIRFPKGLFRVTAPLDVSADQTIEGAGKHLSILRLGDNVGSFGAQGDAAGTHKGMFTAKYTDNVTIRGLGFDGNRANGNGNGNGVYAFGSSNLLVEHCGFKSFTATTEGEYGNGVRVTRDPAEAIPRNARILFCDITDVLQSWAVQISWNVEATDVSHCRVTACRGGIDFSTGNFFRCIGNYVSGVTIAVIGAINLQYAYEGTVVGNVLEDNATGIQGHTQRSVISGNRIKGRGTGSGRGILISPDSHGFNAITGNQIYNVQAAIELQSGSGNVITGNVVSSSGTNSVILAAATSNNKGTGNYFSGAISDAGTGNTVT